MKLMRYERNIFLARQPTCGRVPPLAREMGVTMNALELACLEFDDACAEIDAIRAGKDCTYEEYVAANDARQYWYKMLEQLGYWND